jgi:hypothetical protein
MRTVSVRAVLIALSFCAGLAVFQLPGRSYASVPEVWLPAGQNERDAILKLPVKTRPGQSHGVRFVSAYPDGPEIIEVDANKARVKAADCPDFYDTEELLPSGCDVVGKVDGNKVYSITRELPSMNVQAYMMRGDTLIAISGVYSGEGALAYLKSFKKTARRNVNDVLSSNQQQVDRASRAVKAEKRADMKRRTEAYKYVSFEPALPATLPAGWIQHSIRIDGQDARHPEGVEVLYKKGPDRFIGYSMRPKAGFTLGLHCGPTPTESESMLPCGPVPGENYYSGGISGYDHASWYLYRPVGDMVAIFHVSVHSTDGRPLLFSNEDLDAQILIAKSLRVTSKDRLKGAEFPGPGFDPYPYILP